MSSDHLINTNIVTIIGKVVGDKKFSHEIYGEGFYIYNMEIPRLSEVVDCLPLTVSDRLLIGEGLKDGDMIKVEGQLRSYNKFIDNSNRLVLTIFAKHITFLKMKRSLKIQIKFFRGLYM